MKEPNYRLALEIAHKHLDSGISFMELKSKLKIPQESRASMRVFMNWYFFNFYVPKGGNEADKNTNVIAFNELDSIGKGDLLSVSRLNKYVEHKGYLSIRGMKEYMDYTELKEARESSMTAIKYARYALLVSIIVGIAQIIISIF